MVVKKAWMAMATLLAFAALPACAKSNVGTTATSATGTAAGGGDTGGGGSGTGGQGGDGGVANVCGDGVIATSELCDDGNTIDGDGCDAECKPEMGWDCADAPSICKTKCGDGLLLGDELCDDGNHDPKDGCNTTCQVEFGYLCDGSPSICATVCGDGQLAGPEECDDSNTKTNDGCSDTCLVEKGWSCVSMPSKCTTGCGDGTIAGSEACDDHNFTDGDGCSDSCQVEDFWKCTGSPSVCVTPCGDGQVTGTELCDDHNTTNGDGCSDTCKPEPGFTCSGVPSVCTSTCGDGVKIVGVEQCDDGNNVNNDGCNAVCKVEPGFTCTGDAPTTCTTVCGDGYTAGQETCDVGPPVANDGCDATCHAEHGYICNNFPSVCTTVCGDGVVGGTEQCDDGNNVSGDGCSPTCGVIQGYTCAGEPSVCTTVCGDGIQAGGEQCDDGNLVAGDCCSPTCGAENGCEVEPNDLIDTANDFAARSISGTVKGTLNPSGDLDVYLVTIPAGQTGVINAQTIDGFSSSCLNLTQDTVITVYDANGTTLGTDDNTGPGNCALIQVAGLAGGSYYVEVKNKVATPVSYGLSVQIQLVICGNGTIEPGEQCDDSNASNGDGCSSTCQIEVVTELEPNDTPAQALTNGAFPVGQLWQGAITPIGDPDFYLVHLNTTSDLRIETFDGNGPGTCVTIDTKAFLFASDGTTQLAVDDDAGINNCSLIDPTTATGLGARHLLPGNYYIRIQHYNGVGTVIIPAYRVLVTFSAVCGNGIIEGGEQCDGSGGSPCDANCNRIPTCGDGIIDAPEQCDDLNTVNGDGCSSTCMVEGIANEVEPNNTFAQATANALQITGDLKILASISAASDKDYFAFSLATASVVRFETFEGATPNCPAIATKINLYNSAQAAVNNDISTGIGSCSALLVYLNAGNYFVEVEQATTSAAIPNYMLEVKIETNLGSEVEPNDTQATATSLPGADVYIYGDHQNGADLDYYAVTVPAGKSVRAEVVEGDLSETCESNGIDSYLRLFNAAATSLATDDDSGRGFCSVIDGTGSVPAFSGAHALAAGTYYLQVGKSSLASATGAVFNYRLAVTVR
jgi:cysteine-rich repeat protein